MDNLELVSFQLISNVGEARSALFEAMRAAREECFEEADKLVMDAEDSLIKAHESHSSLIMQEASGDKVQISLLLMHAEDQLMTTELLKGMAKEVILTHKKYSNK
ncbi:MULTISPECIES: PTS lactose/cellobiose transporter subunit IIA [unclassified Clostridium]|uniref:PTS lactose/cellobiose transporter subunit IIA n=1 Tax=unclassified Clostridium TaxID=2614128 RepID=UPI001898B6EF|nr:MULTISPECIES: PTS lactose/cellobiose transporter subunit IIA [unclassified Clostridium]MCR1950466.1 PTS lactose/cellobiose transporter subunit IIA [Clostridium sp. DSM 100503]